jgi:hypothetical protein
VLLAVVDGPIGQKLADGVMYGAPAPFSLHFVARQVTQPHACGGQACPSQVDGVWLAFASRSVGGRLSDQGARIRPLATVLTWAQGHRWSGLLFHLAHPDMRAITSSRFAF